MSEQPELLLSEVEIHDAVAELGRRISSDHPEGIVVVGVLKGGVCLVADLLRAITVPCVVDFLALSSYAGAPTRVRILKDVDIDVVGVDVVLVEDVVDTGLSAAYLLRLFAERGARSVSLCTLLDRPRRRIVPLSIAYVGFEAPEEYLVGYGLDLAGRYRNLRAIYRIEPGPAQQSAMGSSERAREDGGGARRSSPGTTREEPVLDEALFAHLDAALYQAG